MKKEIIDAVFKEPLESREFYIHKYPERELKEGAIVTRYGPSPTGHIHMGNLFACVVASKAAHDTDGVYFLRIEDTDKKREIENGIIGIIEDLKAFHISFDEGVTGENTEVGSYGPYIQSTRKAIYQTFVKELLEKEQAYISFATTEELEKIRALQEQTKDRLGYYGAYATDRNLSDEEVLTRLTGGEPFVVRLKSKGDFHRKFTFNDLVKGKVDFPQNDIDTIIMKGDGLPTYHFAHVVDDYLMHTTLVVRGDDWFSSVPTHIELWEAIGVKPPKYAHTPQLLKEENGTKRKLSKRKDPEAAVSYYEKEGIPPRAVTLYLMTIANSNFEEFLLQNKDKTLEDFTFDFKKMSKSGALFDIEKLKNISRNYLSTLTATVVYEELLSYTKKHDEDFYTLIEKYKEETIATLNIERQQKKPRKDFYSYSDVKNQIWYMYDELFTPEAYEFESTITKEEIETILKTYITSYYKEEDPEDVWFSKLKDLAEELGYAREVKEYKNNPDAYKGHVGDISMVIRVAITSKAMTPNLYDIIKILGKERMKKRIDMIEKKTV